VLGAGKAKDFLVEVVSGRAVVGVHGNRGGLVELDGPNRRQEGAAVQNPRPVLHHDVGRRDGDRCGRSARQPCQDQDEGAEEFPEDSHLLSVVPAAGAVDGAIGTTGMRFG
jgi:hypothetical protein